MRKRVTLIACVLLAFAGIVSAQPTTTLSVAVGPEAALTVTTGTTNLATAATNFSLPFTGTTNFLYFIRTSKSSGTGTITSVVTTDFSPAGGPSVVTAPTTGDALTYSCTVSTPATACTGPITASKAAATNVASFGAAASSTKAGNSGSVAWSLTDDPLYATGTYTATVTFAISAT